MFYIAYRGDLVFSKVSNPAEVEVLNVAVKQTVYYNTDFKIVLRKYYVYISVACNIFVCIFQSRGLLAEAILQHLKLRH